MSAAFGWKSMAWAAAVLALPATSCRRPAVAARDELKDAGYQPTAADFFRAAQENNVAVMKKFLSSGFAADTRDAAGDSALHAAAAAGKKDAAEFLLDRKLPVDISGAGGRTPLMAAATADSGEMVRYLIRQGAMPDARDAAGFTPLMLAVRANANHAVAELAPHARAELDAALLVASLEGRAPMIDTLTRYGASVYARMEDGRTPLMLAAQNNHPDAVKILLDLGSGRFATTPEGKTAADFATEENHPGIVALIMAKPVESDLVLETPETISAKMEQQLAATDAAVASEHPGEISDTAIAPDTAPGSPPAGSQPPDARPPAPAPAREPVRPIMGSTIALAKPPPAPARDNGPGPAATPAPAGETSAAPANRPALVMRQYRAREMPLRVQSVSGDVATLRIEDRPPRHVKVATGQPIPGSRLVITAVKRKMAGAKDQDGPPVEVSVVEIADTRSGAHRELVVGAPPVAHDPVAIVEDAVSGKRYTASPGQTFRGADGSEFRVVDVRPNQIVISEVATGATTTLPLRGSRG